MVLESGFEATGTEFSGGKEDLVELTDFTRLMLLNSCFSVFFFEKEMSSISCLQ